MFDGELGKKMMIEQGYVPSTCTLPVELAGPLIWYETVDGRDVCAGCRHDRRICHGRPNMENPLQTTRGPNRRDEASEQEERRRATENPVFSPWQEIE